MIEVLIADDQALVRTGLRMILEVEADLDVVGEAADGREAVELALDLRPAVVLMDVRMPELDGIAATAELGRRTATPPAVLMLTTFDTDEHVYDAIKAGAVGFLLKNAPPAQLVEAVRAAATGDAQLAPEVIRRLLDDFAARPRPGLTRPPQLDELTERETEVLQLVARGLSNLEIAAQLFLSEATVRTHLTRILAKLGLRDRTQAVVLAYESGLVRPGVPS